MYVGCMTYNVGVYTHESRTCTIKVEPQLHVYDVHVHRNLFCFVDYETNRLYWVDAKNHNIGSCTLDGGDNRLIYAHLSSLKHPFAITVFEVRTRLAGCCCASL